MPDVDLAYLFGLPPEQAVAYLKKKGFAFSWDWEEVWQAAHAKAFTVAKAMRLDILQDIRDAVTRALAEGRTLRQFQQELTPLLQAKGWWGRPLLGDGAGGAVQVQLGSPRRLRTIYEVNLQTSYMVGRYQSMMENVTARPYWMYVAVLDSRTRPAHRALHGTIARYDSPFWNHFYPPNGWRCRCRVRSLTKDQAIAMVQNGQGVWVDEKSLGTTEKLITPRTGELAEVATYRIGERIVSPDVGWSYNPGKAAWQPDLNKYDPEVRRLW